MNFGAHFQAWLTSNLQPLVLSGLAVFGVYLLFKREFTKLLGFGLVSLISVGLVFNTAGVKTLLLNLFKKFLG